MSQVAIVRCDSTTYDLDRVEQAVRRAVDLIGGMALFVQPGQRVLVKPNLLSKSHPSKAIVTHPSVVRAVVRLVQEAGGSVVIGDSPGGSFSEAHLREVYEASGLCAVAAETGATLNFDVGTILVSHPEGRLMKALDLARFATEADVIISLPKLKTHGLFGFTGAVKNLFGLVPGQTKRFYHAKLWNAEQFSEMLLDLVTLVKPAFHLMDGIVGMDGDGPSAGDPFPAGLVLCSTDAVALDLVATQLVGLELDRVVSLRVAKRRGLTTGRVADVDIVGTPFDEARVQGFRPARTGMADYSFVPTFLRRLFIGQLVASPRPSDRCIGCGICVENCPMHAITLSSNRIQIDLGRCIRCYCCHELCPQNAIDLTRPWLQNVMK